MGSSPNLNGDCNLQWISIQGCDHTQLVVAVKFSYPFPYPYSFYSIWTTRRFLRCGETRAEEAVYVITVCAESTQQTEHNLMFVCLYDIDGQLE